MTNKNQLYKFFDMLKTKEYTIQEDLYRSLIQADKHKNVFLITIQQNKD